MKPGRFIAVVGPSGVGKDSVMAGLSASRPNLITVRRVITRPADAGGEDFDSLTEAEFARQVARGEFVLHWGAHGLFYGIPATVADTFAEGRDVLANLSRAALTEAAARFPRLVILSLTARPETLARRLSGRGRETAADIAARLARTAQPFPAGVPVMAISNDGALSDAVADALAALFPPVVVDDPELPGRGLSVQGDPHLGPVDGPVDGPDDGLRGMKHDAKQVWTDDRKV